MVPRRLTLALAVVATATASLIATRPEPVGAASGRPMPAIGSAITLLGAHTLDQALTNLAAAGVDVIRPDFLWQRMEPEPGRYDFRSEDQLVSAAASHGIEVVAILAYGNPAYSRMGSAARAIGLGDGAPPFGVGATWLYPPDPEHLPEYRRFARAAAAHFAGRVNRWEVWNEENVGWRFWPPHEDAAAYAHILRAASDGLRAGNPKAVVSSGGVFFPEVPPGLPEEGGVRYLGHVYDADPQIGDAIDAVAWHPYPYPFVAPEVEIPGNGSVVSTVGQIRGLAATRRDPAEKLWVTELGWPTHQEYGVTETRQAAYLARSFASLWTEGAELLVWYTYADGPFGQHNQEDAFGLFRYDGYAKPSYLALRTFTSLLGGCRADGSTAAKLGLAANEHALRFACPQGYITMLWTSPETTTTDYGPLEESDARRMVSFPAHSPAVVVNVTGRANRYDVKRGRISVEISPSPVYVADGFAPDPLRRFR